MVHTVLVQSGTILDMLQWIVCRMEERGFKDVPNSAYLAISSIYLSIIYLIYLSSIVYLPFYSFIYFLTSFS